MAHRLLVPELHDIGKLLATTSLPLGNHTFSGWQFNKFCAENNIALPDTATWRGITGHHIDAPHDKDLFLLKLADHLAAGVARNPHAYGKWGRLVKLWNDPKIVTDENLLEKAPRLSSPDDLRRVIEFIKEDPTAEEFFSEPAFQEILLTRPEDMRAPGNLSSLETHCRLVGKFYRFFENRVAFDAEKKVAVFDGISASSVAMAKKNWKLRLILCHFEIGAYIWRAGDLGALKNRFELMMNLQKRDDVLLSLPGEALIIVHPSEHNVFQEILRQAHNKGFYVLTEEVTDRLVDAAPTPAIRKQSWLRDRELPPGDDESSPEQIAAFERIFGHKSYYPDQPVEISIQESDSYLCEVCQMAPGTKEFPRDYLLARHEKMLSEGRQYFCESCAEIVRETPWNEVAGELCEKCAGNEDLAGWLEQRVIDRLCETCLQRRVDAPRFSKLQDWDDNDLVAWIHITLPIEPSAKELQKLYESYLTNHGYDKRFEKLPEEHRPIAELRFSTIAHLYADYQHFLTRLNQATNELFNVTEDTNANVELGWARRDSGPGLDRYQPNDVIAVRMDSPARILDFLRLYSELVSEQFKTFCSKASPLQLGISCGRARHPFFDHWRYISAPPEEVSIRLLGKGEVRFSLAQLDKVLSIVASGFPTQHRIRRVLHTLAEIAETSRHLADIKLMDRTDRRDPNRFTYDTVCNLLDVMSHRSLLTLAEIAGSDVS